MRQFVTFHILLFVLSILSTFQHECVHDKIETDIKINDASYAMYTRPEGRVLQSYDNINLLIDTTTLTGVSSEFSDYIANSIMPAVESYVEATFKVPPRTANLKAGGFSSLCGGDIQVPSIYNTEGVDADIVLFVRAVNDPNAPYVASASACLLDTTTQRPLIGRMTYNLAKMAATMNDAKREQHIVTTLHEFTHVLGFSNGLYTYYINPDTHKPLTGHVYTKTIMGLPTTVINLPGLTSRIRTYFNCSSIEGAYLENQGGSGSIGSHFERRIFYNEYMTASSLIDSRISQFTLALLEGTGWYQVNYDMAESMTWGKNKGCSFITGDCVNKATQKVNFEEFCPTLLASSCTWTGRAGASCGAFNLQVQNNIPSAMNWWKNYTISQDSFSDNCPVRLPYGNMDCEDADNQVGATIQDESFGYGSKCFMATLYPRGKLKSAYPYCFKSQCQTDSNGKFVIQLTVGKKSVTCESESQVSVPGYSGVINCPNPQTFCQRQTSEGYCRRGCTGRGTCKNQKCVCEPGWEGYDCSKAIDSSSSFTTEVNMKVTTDTETGSITTEFISRTNQNESDLMEKGSSKSLLLPILLSVVGLVVIVGLILLVRHIRGSFAKRVKSYRMPPKLTVSTQKVPEDVCVSSNQNSPELSKRPLNDASSNQSSPELSVRPLNYPSSHQDSPILPPNSKARSRLYSPSIFKNIATPSRVREEGEEFGIKLQPMTPESKAADVENPDTVPMSFLARLEQPDSEQMSPIKSIDNQDGC